MEILGLDFSNEIGRFNAVKLQAEVAVISSIFATLTEMIDQDKEETNGPE